MVLRDWPNWSKGAIAGAVFALIMNFLSITTQIILSDRISMLYIPIYFFSPLTLINILFFAIIGLIIFSLVKNYKKHKQLKGKSPLWFKTGVAAFILGFVHTAFSYFLNIVVYQILVNQGYSIFPRWYSLLNAITWDITFSTNILTLFPLINLPVSLVTNQIYYLFFLLIIIPIIYFFVGVFLGWIIQTIKSKKSKNPEIRE